MNEINKKEIKQEIENEINNKFWEVYADTTSRLSSICRQLAFAEGGICWFFLTDNTHRLSLDIKIILIFLVVFFIFDACQYLTLAMYNKIVALLYEEHLKNGLIKNKDQITRPVWINSAGNL